MSGKASKYANDTRPPCVRIPVVKRPSFLFDLWWGKVPFLGWIQILIFCGMVDFGLYRQGFSEELGEQPHIK